MTTVPPGWYDDGHGGMRWWDGSQWTEHVAVPEAAETAVPGQVPGGSPYWGGEPPATGAAPPSGGALGIPHRGGASAPASQPRKSRLWIVWVGLGAVVAGAVLAVLVGVPLLTALPSTSGDSAGETPNEIITVEPTPVLELTVDEQAAVDTVERFNEAWLTGDCVAYFETTTVEFRADLELGNCDLFAEASQGFADSVADYEVTVGSVTTSKGIIFVATTEAYSSTYDDDGVDTGVPIDYEDEYEYRLVTTVAGGWAIYAVL